MRGTTQPPPVKEKKNQGNKIGQIGSIWVMPVVIGHAAHADVKFPGTRRAASRQDKGRAKNIFKLTAFEIALSVDALPRARTTAVDTARCPTEALLHARATAEPTPSVIVIVRPLRGTLTLGLALAVADFVVALAFAMHGVVRRMRRESVRALESAGVSVDTGGGAVLRVVALVIRGGVDDL